jgi:hypothetical protein
MLTNKMSIIMVLCIGLVAGMVGAKFLDWLSANGGETQLPDRVTTLPNNNTSMTSRSNNTLLVSRLSRSNASRISDLEDKYSSILPGDGAESAMGEDEHHHEEPEEITPEILEQRSEESRIIWEKIVEEIDREPIEHEWAEKAEGLLEAELNTIGGIAGFETLDTICHSTSCSSRIAFPSYQHAAEKVSRILHEEYQVNCEMGFRIPEPEDPYEQYETTILFKNCTR